MNSNRIIYLSNALDEKTKNTRSITTDSPAATKKVFSLCKALQSSGIDCMVLSMGRGRQNSSGKKFTCLSKDVDNIPVVYASFWHLPFLTHIVTALSLMMLLGQKLRQGDASVVVYNRCWHYIPALFLAKILKIRCFLDLEDGWVNTKSFSQKILTLFFDWTCQAGSLLACTALEKQVKTHSNLACYGAATYSKMVRKSWDVERLQVVFGGSLCEGTGVYLFIEAIKYFIKHHPLLTNDLHIVVVGFGDLSDELRLFAMQTDGLVEFRGSVSNQDYQKLLDESHAGLCLKLTSGPFHDSTFPSKVLEISSQGLLLISTAVSDVPRIFSSQQAILLQDESPECLAQALLWMVTHRDEAEVIAMRGSKMILNKFSFKAVGAELVSFFTEGKD